MKIRWKDPLDVAFLIASVATAVLAMLKLSGVIEWDWRWVMLPIWAVTGLVALMGAVSFVRWISGNKR